MFFTVCKCYVPCYGYCNASLDKCKRVGCCWRPKEWTKYKKADQCVKYWLGKFLIVPTSPQQIACPIEFNPGIITHANFLDVIEQVATYFCNEFNFWPFHFWGCFIILCTMECHCKADAPLRVAESSKGSSIKNIILLQVLQTFKPAKGAQNIHSVTVPCCIF